jgi:hypothetical protein
MAVFPYGENFRLRHVLHAVHSNQDIDVLSHGRMLRTRPARPTTCRPSQSAISESVAASISADSRKATLSVAEAFVVRDCKDVYMINLGDRVPSDLRILQVGDLVAH